MNKRRGSISTSTKKSADIGNIMENLFNEKTSMLSSWINSWIND